MPAEQITAVLQPARVLPQPIALLHFLRRELAPFPGRTVATVRVVVACVTVLVLCMTRRVPEAYLSVWLVTRFAMEESSQIQVSESSVPTPAGTSPA
jgi:hypothetical protein